MRTPATRRRSAAGLLSLSLALVLAACVAPARPEPARTTAPPAVAPLEVDPALDPRSGGGEHTRDWNLAARSGGLDALAAAVVTTPGAAAQVGLWRWAVEGGAVRVDADLGVPGTVGDVALALVEGFAVVAGTTTVDRRATAFVRTSRDLARWDAVEVRPAAVRLVEATSQGSVPHVAGTSAQDAVVWGEVGQDGVDVVEIVPPVEGTRRTVVDVAASGAPGEHDVVAVLYRETGPDGVERSLVIARDAAGTWQEPSLVDARPRVVVNGVRARFGGGWTATGAAPLGPERGGILRPAAWRAPDGRTWSPIEDEFLGDAQWGADVSTDWVLGKPSETGDAVPMWEVGGRRVYSVIALDDEADSWWNVLYASAPAPVTDVTGVIEYPEGGVPITFVTGSGFATVGTLEPSPDLNESWWALADVSEVSAPTGLQVTAGTAGYVGTKELVEVGDGWRTTWAARGWRVDGGALVPAEVPSAVGTRTWSEGHDASGGRLLVHQEWTEGVSLRAVTTLVPADGDPVTGEVGSGGATVGEVAHDGHRWVLVGHDADSAQVGEVGRAMAWTSEDGAGWTPHGLDTGGARDSDAEAVCQGGTLAVGWTRGHDGTARPAAWRLDGDVRPVAHGVSTDGDAWFVDCVTSRGSTLVHGYVGGYAVVWRADDEGRLVESWRAPVGATAGAPVPVGTGWAAWGSRDDTEDTGPVLWWSADGEAWTPVPLPTDLPVGEGVVVADGDAVVALAEGAAGMTAWRVTNLPQRPGGGV